MEKAYTLEGGGKPKLSATLLSRILVACDRENTKKVLWHEALTEDFSCHSDHRKVLPN